MKRARMVLCGPRGALGGSERVADGIEAVLRGDGWDVDWVSPDVLTRLPTSSRYPALNLFLASWALTREARRRGPVDLTVSHGAFGHGVSGARAHVYHGTFRGLAEGCRAGLPWQDFLVLSRLNGWLERQSGTGAQRSAVSRLAADEVGRYYHLPATRVIHNAVDTSHLRPLGSSEGVRAAWGLPADRLLLLVVGRMDYGKGREVIRGMLPAMPPQVLVVFASPAHSGMQSLPSERIRVLSGVPYEQLPRLYAACDAVLCPSLYEGFALTPIEAWACGRPVVTSRVGVITELSSAPHLAAFTAPPGDAEGLAAAVSALCADSEARRRQAEWGRALVEEQFSMSRFAAGYRDLCSAALDGGTPATSPAA